MIIILGSAIVRSDCRADALALGITHSSRSRDEPGCISHNCHIDAENPDKLVFVEQWADMAAVKQHFAVPDSGEFVRLLSQMAIAAPEMQLFAADELNR